MKLALGVLGSAIALGLFTAAGCVGSTPSPAAIRPTSPKLGYDLVMQATACCGALLDVFHVPAPAVSDDAPAPLRTGTWLAYLTEVAKAAGHPVAADAIDPQNREPLAWTGVLEGFADRLRAASPPDQAGLADVTRLVIARLDDEYQNERVVYEAHAPAFR